MKLILCVVTVGAVATLFGKVKGSEDDLEPAAQMTESLSELITENGRSMHTQMGVMERIRGGLPAPVVPYMAMVLQDNFFYCGGSILSRRWVLTAAHCINTTIQYQVKTGTRFFTGGGTTTNVSVLAIHDKHNPATGDYDVALLGLSILLTFDDFTYNVKVPCQCQDISNIDIVHSYGFGCLHLDVLPTELQQGTFNKISGSECQEAYEGLLTITPRMFCVLYGTPCLRLGDSGGPVIIPGTDTQIGVVSFRSPRRFGLPTIIANVASMMDWVEQTMQNPENDFPSHKDDYGRENFI